MIFVYITAPSKDDALKISKFCIKNNLAACANLTPIISMYRWEGKIQKDEEYTIILKTKKSLFNRIKSEVSQIHPYEIPCIIKIEANANKEFESWINSNVSTSRFKKITK